MNDPIDLSVPWLEPYREAAATGGASFGTLLWKSEEFQRMRFRVMAEMLDMTGRVVIDCGCGRADLLVYLASKGIDYRAYVGVDALPVMVEHCQNRIQKQGLLRARAILGDFVSGAGAGGGGGSSGGSSGGTSGGAGEGGGGGAFATYIRDLGAGTHALGGGGEIFVFSGSLNTLDQVMALRVLERAWNALVPGGQGEGRPGAGMIFNFLSGACGNKWRGVDTGPAKRFDPRAMMDFALGRSAKVAFRQDYLDGHDATILMLV